MKALQKVSKSLAVIPIAGVIALTGGVILAPAAQAAQVCLIAPNGAEYCFDNGQGDGTGGGGSGTGSGSVGDSSYKVGEVPPPPPSPAPQVAPVPRPEPAPVPAPYYPPPVQTLPQPVPNTASQPVKKVIPVTPDTRTSMESPSNSGQADSGSASHSGTAGEPTTVAPSDGSTITEDSETSDNAVTADSVSPINDSLSATADSSRSESGANSSEKGLEINLKAEQTSEKEDFPVLSLIFTILGFAALIGAAIFGFFRYLNHRAIEADIEAKRNRKFPQKSLPNQNL